MVNQTFKPMIKPFPILLKSQFAIEILSHNKGQSMTSWPLMELIYLLMQEELNEEQSMTIQTIIENNPMIYNAIQHVHEHHETVKNTHYSRPINIINRQLLLINTLLKTDHMNPVVNYHELQKLIDLNISSSSKEQISSSIEIRNEYAKRYVKNNLKIQHSENIDTNNHENGMTLITKNTHVYRDTPVLNNYAKLYLRDALKASTEQISTQNESVKTLEKSSERHFLSKLVNRILGRNQKSNDLENSTLTQNRNTEAMASFTQWSATQLLTAIEMSMPIAHYINQTSNRFIYRSYVAHKLERFYDEVNQHIQSSKFTEIPNPVFKKRDVIKPNDTLIKHAVFSKTQLTAHENRMNAMLQYSVRNKNSLFIDSIKQHVNNDNNLSNHTVMNSNSQINTIVKSDSTTNLYSISNKNTDIHLSDYHDSNLNLNSNRYINSEINDNSISRYIDMNRYASDDLIHNLFETNTLYRSLNLINKKMPLNEPFASEKITIHQTVIDNTFQYSQLYKITNNHIQDKPTNEIKIQNQFMNQGKFVNQNQFANQGKFINQNNERLIYQNVRLENQAIHINSNTFENRNKIINTSTNTNNINHQVARHNNTDSLTQYNMPSQESFQNLSVFNRHNNRYHLNEMNSNSMYHQTFNRASYGPTVKVEPYNETVFNRNSNYYSNAIPTHLNNNNNNSNSNINSNNNYGSNLNFNHQFNSASRNLNNLYDVNNNTLTHNNFEVETVFNYGDRYRYNPLMVYRMRYSDLHNDYQSAIKHIILTQMEAVYNFDNRINAFNESMKQIVNAHMNEHITKGIDKFTNNAIENLTNIAINRVQSVNLFNDSYLKDIHKKYNTLKNTNTFTLDLANRFFNTHDAKFIKQIHQTLEQVKSLYFDRLNLYTQAAQENRNNVFDLKSEMHQHQIQPLNLYQGDIQKALIKHSTFSIDQFLTYRFDTLNQMLRDDRVQSSVHHLKSRSFNQIDLFSVTKEQTFNEPQSLIRLASSLINQSNRFQRFYYNNKLIGSEVVTNLILQTAIRGEKSINSLWLKSILNRTSDKTINQSIFNPFYINQISEESSFTHTFEMLYPQAYTSIQEDTFLSEVNHFINQSILRKIKKTRTANDQNSAQNSDQNTDQYAELSANITSNLNLHLALNASSESEFNPALDHITSHYLKNIIENKTFLVNLEHKQLKLAQSNFRNENLNQNENLFNQRLSLFNHNVNLFDPNVEINTDVFLNSDTTSYNLENKGVYTLQQIRALLKTYPIRTQAKLIMNAHKRLKNINHLNHLSNSNILNRFQSSNNLSVFDTVEAPLTVTDMLNASQVHEVIDFNYMNSLASIINASKKFQIHISNYADDHSLKHTQNEHDNSVHHIITVNNLHNIEQMNLLKQMDNILYMNRTNRTDHTYNINSENQTNNKNNLNRLNHTHNMTTLHNEMRVNPKIITLNLNHKVFKKTFNRGFNQSLDQSVNETRLGSDQTNNYASKWQNTVILKNDDESIKLTLNASYLRQSITPINQIKAPSVDYTHEISLLMAELADTQKSSEKVKGRKQKKAARKKEEKRKALEREIERLNLQIKQQEQQRLAHKQYPELVPAYVYQSLKASQKQLDGESIIQSQLHYKNQFVKSKAENKSPLKLSEKTVKMISNYTKTLQKNMKQINILHDIKTPSVTNNTVQMSTYLLQKQTPVNLTHHTDQVMSYSDVESSQLSHKTVEREIIREVMAAPEMTSLLPKDAQESAQNVEPAVAPLPETINIDKIADQVYKRVTDRVERERRRRGL